jgi:hypothetical protein|tara:strand:+ start:124 stop:426 length:303 start_codon:yes stop_codon:yes gene_type:complete
MSKQYDNTNKGVLFPNNYKSKSNQPDVKGDINIEGEDYKLAGWIREKNDTQYFSLIAEKKDEEQTETTHNPIGQVMGNAPKPTEVPELPPSEVGEEDVPF